LDPDVSPYGETPRICEKNNLIILIFLSFPRNPLESRLVGRHLALKNPVMQNPERRWWQAIINAVK
jgi:hypothetical protein